MIFDLAKTREDLGLRNRRAVLAEVLLKGPIARTSIADKTGLTGASVSRITRDLIKSGLIEESEEVEDTGKVGRPYIALRGKPNKCFVACITMNAFRQDVVIADITNATVASRRLSIDNLTDYERALNNAVKTLQILIDEMGIEEHKMISCGVAITGATNPAIGVISSSILGWQNVNVVDFLQKKLSMPVFLENLPNAKNLALYGFGKIEGINNVVLFNMSLAVGCSLLLDGSLIRGSHNNIGTIKGMKIPNPISGRLEPFDHVAGGLAVIGKESLSQKNDSNLAAKLMEMTTQADLGNSEVLKKFSNAAQAFAYVVSMTNAMLHPQKIIISGPMAKCEAYCDTLRLELSKQIDASFVQDKLRFSTISSKKAAQTLAIYQTIATGKILKSTNQQKSNQINIA